MPLKNRQELEEIALNVRDIFDDDKMTMEEAYLKASQLLDQLQVDAMRYAAAIVSSHNPGRTLVGYDRSILAAIENREKI